MGQKLYNIKISTAEAGHIPVEAITTTSATFQINNAKLYVPVAYKR